jgi:hypothetical protein
MTDIIKNGVTEQTAAIQTLKPSNTTKSEMLSQMMKHFAGMKKEDLSKYLTDTLAQIGREADAIPAGAAAQNQASIAMKEDVKELFDGQELSEEFKDKASTIFEAAVNNRVDIEVARIQEELQQKSEEEVETQVMEAIQAIHEKVEKYMDYVAEEWMKENELAIVSNYRIEETESFIEGLKDLFKEHYIEVPEEKLDVLETLQLQVEELKTKLNEEISSKIDLYKQIEESKTKNIFSSIAEGLTDTQIEKLKTLSESIEYTTEEDYSNKLKTIKEQYFNDKSSKKTTGLINEEAVANNDEINTENQAVIPEEMKHYVNAISKTTRK